MTQKRQKAAMERAFSLSETDARVFLELDQLYKKLGRSFEGRLKNYEAHKALLDGRDDIFVEYVTLVNMCGEHERTYKLMMSRRFHPWEGGEGKLGGTKDNHIYYHLGLALEGQDRLEESRRCYRATVGTDEPAGVMYYNDQPAGMILYQGLAWLKLGDVRAARSRFYWLIDYGERHLEDEGKIEYFAVSLPDFLIFDEDYTAGNRAHCNYLMALGNLGLGDVEKATAFL